MTRRLAALLMSFVLAGCSSATTEVTPAIRATSPASTAQGAPSIQSSLYGPLMDAYYGGVDAVTAEITLARKVENYITECMRTRGHAYRGSVPSEESVRENLISEAYRTELATEDQRITVGYGVSSYLAGKSPDGDAPIAAADPSKAKDEAACAEAAHRSALPGSLIDQVAGLSRIVDQREAQDPTLVRAAQAWSTCMAKEGYTATTFGAPVTQLEEQLSRLSPTDATVGSAAAIKLHRKELAMAKTDWSCRETTYNAAFFEVRNRLELQFLEENFELVDRLKREIAKAVYG